MLVLQIFQYKFMPLSTYNTHDPSMYGMYGRQTADRRQRINVRVESKESHLHRILAKRIIPSVRRRQLNSLLMKMQQRNKLPELLNCPFIKPLSIRTEFLTKAYPDVIETTKEQTNYSKMTSEDISVTGVDHFLVPLREVLPASKLRTPRQQQVPSRRPRLEKFEFIGSRLEPLVLHKTF
jgi:hypothetical protein